MDTLGPTQGLHVHCTHAVHKFRRISLHPTETPVNSGYSDRMHEKLRHRLLVWWAGVISTRPRTVLAVALLVAAASIALTAARLEFQSNRNDLISDELEWNRRFIRWQDTFPGAFDLVVAIDSAPDAGAKSDPSAAPVTALVDELGEALAASDHLDRVVWGFKAEEFSPRAARLLPVDQLRATLEQVAKAEPMLTHASLAELFGGFGAMMRANAEQKDDEHAIAADIGELTSLVDAIGAALNTPADRPLDFARFMQGGAGGLSAEGQWQYLQSANERMFFIRITPRRDVTLLNALEPAIADIRAAIAAIAPKYPAYEVGLTGIEVVENDETEAATVDSAKSSAVAVVLITLLLFAAFHSVRGPVMAMGALLIGVAWSFGFLTLSIGHLQVLSVVFTVILLGLGIAYGIHLSSAYELTRHQHPDDVAGFAATLRRTFEAVGPGVVTGAVTTAAAFMTTIFTDFTGMAEMGLIAGAGVLLCLLAMFSAYPALLRLFKHRHADVRPMVDRNVHFFEERWVMPFVRYPKVTLILTGVVAVAAGLWVGTHMRFDYDLLKLQPPNMPSVQWAQRITRDAGESIYCGVSVVTSMEEARDRAKAFAAKPSVSDRFTGVGLLIPSHEEEKIAMLTAAREKLAPALAAAASDRPSEAEGSAGPSGSAGPFDPTSSIGKGELLSQLGAMKLSLQVAMVTKMPDVVRAALGGVQRSLDAAAKIAAGLDDETRAARVARLEAAYAEFRAKATEQINAMLDTSPLTLEDMPAELMRSYRDDQGRLVLEVHPILGDDQSPLDSAFLHQFISDMKSVDPDITGVIVQIYESGSLIKNAYIIAGVWALVVVFAFVLVDFRSFNDALLSLIPVAIGFTLTFAIMRFAGMTINPANIIVLPLMFGIGVDSGVHMLHRFRMNPDDQPPGLTHGTGKGITITTYTTVIGFACMMIASHRGIQSLGFVLSVGVLMTMFACWIVMPAWLRLRQMSRA